MNLSFLQLPRAVDARFGQAGWDRGGRVFQARDGFNRMIELIPWDKLIDDAIERNKGILDCAGIVAATFYSGNIARSAGRRATRRSKAA